MRRKTNASKHSTTSRDSIMGKAKEDKKKNIMIVKEIISEICDILRIQVPQISFNAPVSNFESETMMARCNADDSTIYLRKFDKPTPDLIFSIAHELRHIWQLKNDKETYFFTYQTIGEIKDIEKYNSQLAEVDAHAFAKIIMVDLFHLTPLFDGLSDSVKKKIDDRVDVIVSENLF